MQHTWSFDYNQKLNPENLAKFMESQSKELGIFLSYYYKKQGAHADDVSLKSAPEFQTPKNGRFTLEFQLVYFNACLDINEQEKEEMKIDFEYQETANKLLLTGENWPERGMDEI